jgi:methyl-accepting chemotaxis protein
LKTKRTNNLKTILEERTMKDINNYLERQRAVLEELNRKLDRCLEISEENIASTKLMNEVLAEVCNHTKREVE